MRILVLSRFNCVQRHPGSERAARRMEDRRFNKAWQKERLKLMRHFTAPSIKAQTYKRFTWHVFVQEGTSEDVIAEISKMGGSVVRVKKDDVDAAEALVRARTGLIVTVNLDTDDALAPDFLERVFTEVRQKNETMVFLRGMRYRPTPPWAASTKSQTNPFNVKVEKRAQVAETVFAHAHGTVDRVIDTGKPMWLQVVHGDNMDNLTLKRTRKDVNHASEVPKKFGIVPYSWYGRDANGSTGGQPRRV